MAGQAQRIIFNGEAVGDDEHLYCYYIRCLQLYAALCEGLSALCSYAVSHTHDLSLSLSILLSLSSDWSLSLYLTVYISLSLSLTP